MPGVGALGSHLAERDQGEFGESGPRALPILGGRGFCNLGAVLGSSCWNSTSPSNPTGGANAGVWLWRGAHRVNFVLCGWDGKKIKYESLTLPSALSLSGKAVRVPRVRNQWGSSAPPLLASSGSAGRRRRQHSPKGRSRARGPRSLLPGEAALPGWV